MGVDGTPGLIGLWIGREARELVAKLPETPSEEARKADGRARPAWQESAPKLPMIIYKAIMPP